MVVATITFIVIVVGNKGVILLKLVYLRICPMCPFERLQVSGNGRDDIYSRTFITLHLLYLLLLTSFLLLSHVNLY